MARKKQSLKRSDLKIYVTGAPVTVQFRGGRRDEDLVLPPDVVAGIVAACIEDVLPWYLDFLATSPDNLKARRQRAKTRKS